MASGAHETRATQVAGQGTKMERCAHGGRVRAGGRDCASQPGCDHKLVICECARVREWVICYMVIVANRGGTTHTSTHGTIVKRPKLINTKKELAATHSSSDSPPHRQQLSLTRSKLPVILILIPLPFPTAHRLLLHLLALHPPRSSSVPESESVSRPTLSGQPVHASPSRPVHSTAQSSIALRTSAFTLADSTSRVGHVFSLSGSSPASQAGLSRWTGRCRWQGWGCRCRPRLQHQPDKEPRPRWGSGQHSPRNASGRTGVKARVFVLPLRQTTAH
ncbi:hypothetical protein PLICRDRAFT_376859 [Plicaturopsis crispa FD-325 SS-3]|nr:hypothetical protein PLICRDRAFT_376859 [Plicaturopsis crispa FD-325 SS-3]